MISVLDLFILPYQQKLSFALAVGVSARQAYVVLDPTRNTTCCVHAASGSEMSPLSSRQYSFLVEVK
jgi:hypothetical protein